MTKIGPKESALKSKREEIAEGIPDFLKRKETPEQEAKRRKRDAKKPDLTGGLKVIEPLDPKIRKAIEKDLRDDPVAEAVQAIDDRLGELASPTSVKPDVLVEVVTADKMKKLEKIKPPKQKLPRALQKALEEKEKLNQLTATPMETTVKKNTKTTKAKTKAKTAKPAKGNGTAHRYNWKEAEAKAKTGVMPAAPDFSAWTHRYFREALAEAVKYAKAGNIKDLQGMKFKRTDGSPGMVKRYRDLAVVALKAK